MRTSAVINQGCQEIQQSGLPQQNVGCGVVRPLPLLEYEQLIMDGTEANNYTPPSGCSNGGRANWMLWNAFRPVVPEGASLSKEQVNQQFIGRLLNGRYSDDTRFTPVFGEVTKISRKGFEAIVKFLIGTSTDEACRAGIDLICGDDPKLRDTIHASVAALNIALQASSHMYLSGGTKPPVSSSRAATVAVAVKLGVREESTTDDIVRSCSKELDAATRQEDLERRARAKLAVELVKAVRLHSAIAEGQHLRNCGFVPGSGTDRVLEASNMNIMSVHRSIRNPDNPGQRIYSRIAMKDYG